MRRSKGDQIRYLIDNIALAVKMKNKPLIRDYEYRFFRLLRNCEFYLKEDGKILIKEKGG